MTAQQLMDYAVLYFIIGVLVGLVVSVKEKQWELGFVAGAFWPVTLLVLILVFITDKF